MSISFRHFYLPREFPQVHVLLVYIPPDADKDNASRIIQKKTQSPDSSTIILGDFNQCQLETSMPHYHQSIEFATRGDNIIDRCYCSIPSAYKSVIRPGLGASDHHTIHLLPKYNQRVRTVKSTKRTVRIWDETSIDLHVLQTAFEITDWELFRNACNDIHELTDTINSYIVFCEDLHIKSRSVTKYPNSKPWITSDLESIRREKKAAFGSGNNEPVRELNYKLKMKVSEAKANYGEKLENCFQTNNSRDAWICFELMADYSNKKRGNVFAHEENAMQRANELNAFFNRFNDEDFQHKAKEELADLRISDDPPIVIKGEIRNRFTLISEERVKNLQTKQ